MISRNGQDKGSSAGLLWIRAGRRNKFSQLFVEFTDGFGHAGETHLIPTHSLIPKKIL